MVMGKATMDEGLIALKVQARAIIRRFPQLHLDLQYLNPRHRPLVVRRDTDIVIEGYPRSANTFALSAFLVAQERQLKIAHHLHMPAQISRAVKWGIPALVLIRQPKDAVLSFLVRDPSITAKRALQDYIRFYRWIASHHAGFLLATFEDVTQDFGEVIERINQKFGTKFVRFNNDAENVAKAMRLVEEMDKADTGKNIVTETSVARPSVLRDQQKMQARKELENPTVKALLQTARIMYDEMIHIP